MTIVFLICILTLGGLADSQWILKTNYRSKDYYCTVWRNKNVLTIPTNNDKLVMQTLDQFPGAANHKDDLSLDTEDLYPQDFEKSAIAQNSENDFELHKLNWIPICICLAHSRITVDFTFIEPTVVTAYLMHASGVVSGASKPQPVKIWKYTAGPYVGDATIEDLSEYKGHIIMEQDQIPDNFIGNNTNLTFLSTKPDLPLSWVHFAGTEPFVGGGTKLVGNVSNVVPYEIWTNNDDLYSGDAELLYDRTQGKSSLKLLTASSCSSNLVDQVMAFATSLPEGEDLKAIDAKVWPKGTITSSTEWQYLDIILQEKSITSSSSILEFSVKQPSSETEIKTAAEDKLEKLPLEAEPTTIEKKWVLKTNYNSVDYFGIVVLSQMGRSKWVRVYTDGNHARMSTEDGFSAKRSDMILNGKPSPLSFVKSAIAATSEDQFELQRLIWRPVWFFRVIQENGAIVIYIIEPKETKVQLLLAAPGTFHTYDAKIWKYSGPSPYAAIRNFSVFQGLAILECNDMPSNFIQENTPGLMFMSTKPTEAGSWRSFVGVEAFIGGGEKLVVNVSNTVTYEIAVKHHVFSGEAELQYVPMEKKIQSKPLPSEAVISASDSTTIAVPSEAVIRATDITLLTQKSMKWILKTNYISKDYYGDVDRVGHQLLEINAENNKLRMTTLDRFPSKSNDLGLCKKPLPSWFKKSAIGQRGDTEELSTLHWTPIWFTDFVLNETSATFTIIEPKRMTVKLLFVDAYEPWGTRLCHGDGISVSIWKYATVQDPRGDIDNLDNFLGRIVLEWSNVPQNFIGDKTSKLLFLSSSSGDETTWRRFVGTESFIGAGRKLVGNIASTQLRLWIRPGKKGDFRLLVVAKIDEFKRIIKIQPNTTASKYSVSTCEYAEGTFEWKPNIKDYKKHSFGIIRETPSSITGNQAWIQIEVVRVSDFTPIVMTYYLSK